MGYEQDKSVPQKSNELRNEKVSKATDMVKEERNGINGCRVHSLWLTVILFSGSLMIVLQTSSQFLVTRFGKEVRKEWNISEVLNSTRGCFANRSSLSYKIMEESQSRAAEYQTYFSLASGIPSLFTILILGVYSDRIGRKILFILPLLGYTILTAVYAAVSYWEWPLVILFAGHLLEGITGGFVAFLIGAFAFTSDLTGGGRSRSIRIALIESVLPLTMGVTDLGNGYLIRAWGFTIPFVIACLLNVLAAVVAVFLLPESHSKKVSERPGIKQYVKDTFYFYFKKQDNNRRFFFQLSGVIFFLLTIAVLGKARVDILFMLNSPFCWTSVKIGYFGLVHRASFAVCSIILVRVLQKWFSDAKLGGLAAISLTASLVIQGLSSNDTMMFISVGVGCFSGVPISMIRAILSKLTPKGQHGAMFGGIAFVEAVTTLAGGSLYNTIYRATLHVFHGAVYMVIGSLICVAGFFFILLDFFLRKYKFFDEQIIVQSKEDSKSFNMEPKQSKDNEGFTDSYMTKM